MAVLVTGGAGYIGSHAVLALLDAGERVVVIDDLSTGHAKAVVQPAQLVRRDVMDHALVAEMIQKHNVDSVLHFAGSTVVPESIADPLKYYWNNTAKSFSLIQTCVENGVGRFIFSSTAAVYGLTADGSPVAESASLQPVSPYAKSKRATEIALADIAGAHDFAFVALRYFNVAGADPAGRVGQSTPNATHLLKVASEVAVGRRPVMEIFGDDYPTPDGTCIRDFIHVTDLADAHLLALDYLRDGGQSDTFNCGYGHGYSVREVIQAFEDEIGRPLPIQVSGRRAGDLVSVIADSTKIKQTMNWQPQHDDLKEIVRTSLVWEREGHLRMVG